MKHPNWMQTNLHSTKPHLFSVNTVLSNAQNDTRIFDNLALTAFEVLFEFFDLKQIDEISEY
jgi:hypothetical protein